MALRVTIVWSILFLLRKFVSHTYLEFDELEYILQELKPQNCQFVGTLAITIKRSVFISYLKMVYDHSRVAVRTAKKIGYNIARQRYNATR